VKQQRQQSPIFVKTYDFLLWLIPLTLKFPRSQRFLLAERLSKMGLDLYDSILEAVMEPRRQDECLDEADKLLTKIRLYIRLSYDLKCISLTTGTRRSLDGRDRAPHWRLEAKARSSKSGFVGRIRARPHGGRSPATNSLGIGQ